MKHKVWLLLLVLCTLVLLICMDSPSGAYAGSGFTLTISIDPPETGLVTVVPAKDEYFFLEPVTVSPTPSSGWRFSHWTGDDADICDDGQFLMVKDLACTANFVNNFFVFISYEPEDKGNNIKLTPAMFSLDDFPPIPTGYSSGTTVTLTAEPADLFVFEGWEGQDRDECKAGEVTITDHHISCTALFSLELPVPPENHRWMTAIAPAIEDRRLRDVVLPGSHDTGTYSFGQSSEYTEADPVDVIDVAESYIADWVWDIVEEVASAIGRGIKDITAGWAKTQSGNVEWQLNAGMRYFDLRFLQESDGRLYMWHGKLRGRNDSDEFFQQLKAFLESPDKPGHEKEIIILDFSHFRDVDTEHHQGFVDELLRLFKGKMIPAAYRNAPLSAIWTLEGQPQLVVRYDKLDNAWFDNGDSYLNTDEEDLQLFWPRVSSDICGKDDPFMCRSWADAQTENELAEFTADELNCPCCEDDYHTSDQLFMLQGIFTPDEPFIVCAMRKMIDSWLSEFDWVCDIPIAGPITCGLVTDAIELVPCDSGIDWHNMPINLYQMAIGTTIPGDGTPDTVDRAKNWWKNCDNNTRDSLNIIGVDFLEADSYSVVSEAIKINEVEEYNMVPILGALPDQQALEGHTVELSTTFSDRDGCDHHIATIDWDDGSDLDEADVHAIEGDAFPDTIKGNHVYADNGLYDVELCIVDGPQLIPSPPFINEIHYDNVDEDIGEGVEIAGEAGSDLSGWSLMLYKGTDGTVYDTVPIDATIPDLGNGYGTVFVPTPEIENGKDGLVNEPNFNGEADGIAIVDESDNVIQFLCYEGQLTATAGPASGLTCSDIGVSETGYEPPGLSLQLSEYGARYDDFRYSWQEAQDETFGEFNSGQSFISDHYTYSETCGSFQVDVKNVAPTVEAGPDVTIDEAGEIILEPATFNDLGTLDTHTAVIDWGDILPKDPINAKPGIVSENPFGPPGSTSGADGTVAGSFIYGDNSLYIVEVCVTDDDGGTGCDDLAVTVNNVDPTVVFDKSAAISFAGGSAFLARRGVEQTFNSEAADIGSDDLTYAWTFPPSALGSLVTYFNDGSSPDPAHSPHGVFPFYSSDSNKTTFTVPGVYEATIDINDDDSGHVSDSLPLLMTDSRGCTAASSTWGHEYGVGGKQTIDDLRLQGYLDVIRFASAYFDDGNLADLADAQSIFSAKGSSDENHLRQRTLAAWLNFASGGVLWDQQIRHLEGPFHEVIGEIDAVLLNPDATKKDHVDAQQDAIRINTSKSSNSTCNDAGAP